MKDDFPPEARGVNIFQKIKVDRKEVAQRYQKEIDEIYLSPAKRFSFESSGIDHRRGNGIGRAVRGEWLGAE